MSSVAFFNNEPHPEIRELRIHGRPQEVQTGQWKTSANGEVEKFLLIFSQF